MALGQNIKRLREAQDLTQEELAVKAGGKVTQGIIAALEKRDSKASQYAARIAAALGVSVDELLTGEGKPSKESMAPTCGLFLARKKNLFLNTTIVIDTKKTIVLCCAPSVTQTKGRNDERSPLDSRSPVPRARRRA